MLMKTDDPRVQVIPARSARSVLTTQPAPVLLRAPVWFWLLLAAMLALRGPLLGL
jgi:hypothetical protein